MTVTIYGIKNCDTMKKAFNWLTSHGVAYHFHDYRTAGVDAETVKAWCDTVGWERVLNKASTSFKALSDADKAGLDRDKAIALMTREPTMIKRPVLVADDTILTGFKPEIYEDVLETRAR